MADTQPTVPPAVTAPTTGPDIPLKDSSQPSSSTSPPPPSSSSPGPPSPSLSSASSSSSSPPLTPLSSALYDALHPALAHCDTAIDSVFTSQSQLASNIDTLAALLASFNALHRHSATLFSPYTVKLQSAKKRVKRLQLSIDRINSRLNDMRDVVRRKEGLTSSSGTASAAGGGLTGRLSLSSIASIAQQALAVGGGGSTVQADKSETAPTVGRTAVLKTDGDEEKEDESVEEVGEIDTIEALVPVLDKSAAPTTYGSLPASAPSPTSASAAVAEGGLANGTGAERAVAATGSGVTSSNGSTNSTGNAAAALPKSSSVSSAPSSTALLHDLLAWDG